MSAKPQDENIVEVVVQLDAEQRYCIDGKELPIDEVIKHLVQEQSQHSTIVVVIEATRDCPTSIVHEFIHECQKAGIEQFRLRARQ